MNRAAGYLATAAAFTLAAFGAYALAVLGVF